jgi:hypothetical protein
MRCVVLLSLICAAALAGCGDLTALPEPEAAPQMGAALQPATGPEATQNMRPSSASIDRPVCGPEAPLSLSPNCRPLETDYTRSDRRVPGSPDSAAWFEQRRQDAARRDALVTNANRQMTLESNPNALNGPEQNRLARDRLRLEQELNRSPQQELSVSPFGPPASRYGL